MQRSKIPKHWPRLQVWYRMATAATTLEVGKASADASAGPEQCPLPSSRKPASNQGEPSANRPLSPRQKQPAPACVMSGFKDSNHCRSPQSSGWHHLVGVCLKVIPARLAMQACFINHHRAKLSLDSNAYSSLKTTQ